LPVAREEVRDTLGARRIQAGRKRLAYQGLPEKAGGGRISLEHTPAGLVDEKHGLGRHLEQKPVTGLDLPQAPVILLQGLLGIHELLTQGQHGAHVPAHEQDLCPACGHRRVLEMHLGAVRQALRDVAPDRGTGACQRKFGQFEGAGAALVGGCGRPVATGPFGFQGLGQVLAGYSAAQDRPGSADHQGQVRDPPDEGKGGGGIQL
jgi:hypothetical protein